LATKHYLSILPLLPSIQRCDLFPEQKDKRLLSRRPGFQGHSNISLISIDSKYPHLVHVGELCNNKHNHRNSVEEEHWILIVGCVGGYQVPDNDKQYKNKTVNN